MQNHTEQAVEARETYLHEVHSRLRDRLSPLEAHESFQEMRDHLDSMAKAYEEMGMDELSAMQAAIAKFGEASQVGSGLAKAAPPNRTGIGLPVAFLVQVVSISLLGYALMLTQDVVFFIVQMTSKVDPPMDLAVGGTAGLIVGMLGWIWKRSAPIFAVTIFALINTVLGLTIYRAYYELGMPLAFMQLIVSMSISIILLSLASAKAARLLRNIATRHGNRPIRS